MVNNNLKKLTTKWHVKYYFLQFIDTSIFYYIETLLHFQQIQYMTGTKNITEEDAALVMSLSGAAEATCSFVISFIGNVCVYTKTLKIWWIACICKCESVRINFVLLSISL